MRAAFFCPIVRSASWVGECRASEGRAERVAMGLGVHGQRCAFVLCRGGVRFEFRWVQMNRWVAVVYQ